MLIDINYASKAGSGDSRQQDSFNIYKFLFSGRKSNAEKLKLFLKSILLTLFVIAGLQFPFLTNATEAEYSKAPNVPVIIDDELYVIKANDNPNIGNTYMVLPFQVMDINGQLRTVTNEEHGYKLTKLITTLDLVYSIRKNIDIYRDIKLGYIANVESRLAIDITETLGTFAAGQVVQHTLLSSYATAETAFTFGTNKLLTLVGLVSDLVVETGTNSILGSNVIGYSALELVYLRQLEHSILVFEESIQNGDIEQVALEMEGYIFYLKKLASVIENLGKFSYFFHNVLIETTDPYSEGNLDTIQASTGIIGGLWSNFAEGQEAGEVLSNITTGNIKAIKAIASSFLSPLFIESELSSLNEGDYIGIFLSPSDDSVDINYIQYSLPKAKLKLVNSSVSLLFEHQDMILDASNSIDENGLPLTFSWIITDEQNNNVNPDFIQGQNQKTAIFTPDFPSIYTVTLTVSNGYNEDTDVVTLPVYSFEDTQLVENEVSVSSFPGDPTKLVISGYVKKLDGENIAGTITSTIETRTYTADVINGNSERGGSFVFSIDKPQLTSEQSLFVTSSEGDTHQFNLLIEGIDQHPIPEEQIAGEVFISKPAGGELWKPGTNKYIEWVVEGEIAPEQVYRFKLLNADGTLNRELGVRRATKRSEYWRIPENLQEGSYLIGMYDKESDEEITRTNQTFSITKKNIKPIEKTIYIYSQPGVTITEKLKAIDYNDDDLSYSIASQPSEGYASVTADGFLSFESPPELNDEIEISVTVDDGTETAIITIIVQVFSEDDIKDFVLTQSFSLPSSDGEIIRTDGENIFISTGSDQIYKYDFDGNLLSTTQLDSSSISDFQVNERNLVVALFNEDILILDKIEMVVERTIDSGHSSNINAISLGTSRVFSVSNENIRVHNIENSVGGDYTDDGDTHSEGDDINALFYKEFANSDIVLFTGGDSEELVKWTEFGGQVTYAGTETAPADIHSIFALGSSVYVGGDSARIRKYEAGSGSNLNRVWTADLGLGRVTDLSSTGFDVIASSSGNGLYALKSNDGAIRQVITTDTPESIAVFNNFIFVLEANSLLFYERDLNRAPEPTSQTLKVLQNSTNTLKLEANDPDEDDTHTFDLLSEDLYGTVSISDNGVLSYRSEGDFFGEELVNVQVTDESGATETFEVFVDVANFSPRTAEQNYSLNNISPDIGNLTSVKNLFLRNESSDNRPTLKGQLNAVDLDLNDLTFEIIDLPVNGELVLLSDVFGTFEFRPDAGFAGSQFFTYRVTDGHSYSEVKQISIYVFVDEEAPTIFLNGGDVSIVEGETYNDAGATATDNRDGDLSASIVVTGAVDSNVAGVYTLTYNVSDAAGNAAVPVSRAVTVTQAPDTEAPVLTLNGGDVSIVEGETYNDAGATATDNRDGDLSASIVVTGAVDSNVAGVYTLTYNVSDAAGNAAVPVSRAVTVTQAPDTEAPVLTLNGGDVSIVEGETYNDAGATATDNRDGDLSASIVVTGAVDSNVAGVYTLTYNVSDAAGNAAVPVSRTVTVTQAPDTEAPVLTLNGGDVSIVEGETYNDAGATATDNRDGDLSASIVVTGAVDSNVAGVYTLTYNVSDAAGNAAVPVSRAVTVTQAPDTEAPVLTLNGGDVSIVEGETYNDAGATATDNRDGDLSASMVTGAVDSNVAGVYTLTYNVSDAAGNAAVPVSRTVTVTQAPDTEALFATLNGGDVSIVEGETYNDAGATATDNRDGDLSASIVVTGAVDSNVAGVYTLTYNVSDAAGNAAVPVSRAVTVTQAPDTEAPVLTLNGGDVSIVEGETYNDAGATATDNRDGDLSASIVVTGAVDSNVAGVYTLTYNVSDAAGNAAVPVSRAVTVTQAPDTEAPVLTLNGGDVSIVEGETYNDAGATATDNRDGDLSASIVVTGAVDSNVAGVYTLTYNVSDAAGNAAVPVSRTVTVTQAPDTEAPVLTLNGGDLILQIGAVYFEHGAKAVDEVDGDISQNIVITSNVNTSQLGEYTVTYNSTDRNGNSSTAIRGIVVVSPLVNDSPGWRYSKGNLAGTASDDTEYEEAAGELLLSWSDTNASNVVYGGSADIDGDGDLELVTISGGEIRMYEADGSFAYPSISVPDTSDMRILLDDIDSDGANEILIGTRDSSSLTINIYEHDGNNVATLSREGGVDSSMWPVAYLGEERLLVAYTTGFAKEPRGYSIWDLSNSNELWYYDLGPCTGDLSVADVDADGDLDIIGNMFTCHNGASGSGIDGTGTTTTDGDLYTILVDENGDELLVKKLGEDTEGGANGSSTQNLVDLDNDGSYEIVASVGHSNSYRGDAQIRVLDLDGIVKYQVSIGDDANPGFLITDIESDGQKEIVVWSSVLGTLQVFDTELNELSSNIIAETQSFNGYSAADIDGDGIKEILMRDDAIVRSFDGLTLEEEWRYDMGQMLSNVWPSDLNDDGLAELVVTTVDGVVSVFSSVALVNQPPEIDVVSRLTLVEQSSASLDASSSTDPDGDELIFSWSQTSGEVSLEMERIDTSVLTITTPDVTKNESVEITLEVDDGKSIVSEVITIEIIFENQIPTVTFVNPTSAVDEGSSFTIESSASDPDGDQITYSWSETSNLMATMSNTDSSIVSIVAPQVSQQSTLVLKLTVTDSNGGFAEIEHSVVIRNTTQTLTPPPPEKSSSGGGSVSVYFIFWLMWIALNRRSVLYNHRQNG